jgi:hypothetical protein
MVEVLVNRAKPIADGDDRPEGSIVRIAPVRRLIGAASALILIGRIADHTRPVHSI